MYPQASLSAIWSPLGVITSLERSALFRHAINRTRPRTKLDLAVTQPPLLPVTQSLLMALARKIPICAMSSNTAIRLC